MKQPYQLLLDVWEGRPNIDWDVMDANDVAGAIVRLNNMSGGHHMDENFPEMWELLGDRGKARAPYFVFNPWVSGKANFDWLMAHTPWGGRHFIDIEVRKDRVAPGHLHEHDLRLQVPDAGPRHPDDHLHRFMVHPDRHPLANRCRLLVGCLFNRLDQLSQLDCLSVHLEYPDLQQLDLPRPWWSGQRPALAVLGRRLRSPWHGERH